MPEFCMLASGPDGTIEETHKVNTLPQSDWLTSAEAATYLKVSPRTIVKWAKEGQLKGYRLSGTSRITWRFLRADLDAKMLPPSAAITEEYAAEK